MTIYDLLSYAAFRDMFMTWLSVLWRRGQIQCYCYRVPHCPPHPLSGSPLEAWSRRLRGGPSSPNEALQRKHTGDAGDAGDAGGAGERTLYMGTRPLNQ